MWVLSACFFSIYIGHSTIYTGLNPLYLGTFTHTYLSLCLSIYNVKPVCVCVTKNPPKNKKKNTHKHKEYLKKFGILLILNNVCEWWDPELPLVIYYKYC